MEIDTVEETEAVEPEDSSSLFISPDLEMVTKPVPSKKNAVLTESQKEKRREQQQNAGLWNPTSKSRKQVLTTQEIADEIWGDSSKDNRAEPSKKKRKRQEINESESFNRPLEGKSQWTS